MQKAIQEWLEISEYDLETARAMLNTGRYVYVVFMCQQSLEKILKAIYVKKKNELPPRTHNLLYLIEALDIKMSKENVLLLSHLNQFYLESRYPGERAQLAKEMNKERSEKILKESKEVWKCLRGKLQ